MKLNCSMATAQAIARLHLRYHTAFVRILVPPLAKGQRLKSDTPVTVLLIKRSKLWLALRGLR